MRAAHLAAADVDRGGQHLFRSQQLHQQAHARYIGQRVERADLMEVDLLDRDAVNAAFRVRDGLIDGQNVGADGLGDVQMGDAVGQLVQIGMMVRMHMDVRMGGLRRVRVGMRVRLRGVLVGMAFLLAVDQDAHMRAGDAAFDGRLCRDLQPRQAERLHFLQKGILFGQQLQQCGHQHIACRAHGAVQIDRSHSQPPIWLMRLARKPAPKPLSMLTTLTPLAQELSIDRSAETPPKDAP